MIFYIVKVFSISFVYELFYYLFNYGSLTGLFRSSYMSSVVSSYSIRFVVERSAQTYYAYDGIDLIFPSVLIQVFTFSVTSEIECSIWADNTTTTSVNDLSIVDRIILH